MSKQVAFLYPAGTPKGIEEHRSGTWQALNHARKIAKPGVIIFSDGKTASIL